MLVLISWLQDKSHFKLRPGISGADSVTQSGLMACRTGQGQTRPEGDRPSEDLAEAGEVGWPDLIAAITTAQAKNSRSRS
jgi:hypothetical protein